MDLELHNKVVFVSGSSRGIGLAIAKNFLQEGAKVVITGRSVSSLQEAIGSLEKSSEDILAVQGDMTEMNDIQEALEKTIMKFGRLDVVVANVGNGQAASVWALHEEDWQSMLTANLLGSMRLARQALPYLIQYQGNLIFISSIAGCEAIHAPMTYSVAKAALQSAMKNLARLVGPQGVRVNALAPGNILFPGGTWERKLAERRSFFEQYIHVEVPLQRFGTPEEIAHAVVFLASTRASFITGATLVVDGGQTRS